MHTRTVICGLIAGIICAFGVYISFIQVWPNQYIPGWSNFPSWFIVWGLVFNFFIITIAGMLAAAWGWKESRKDAIQTGVAAGMLAAITAYIFSGATVAGLLGFEPMLKFGLHQTDNATFMQLLIQVLTSAPQWMVIVLGVFILSGIFFGAVGGWLAQVSQFKFGPAPKQLPGWLITLPASFTLILTPIMIVVTVASLAIMPELISKTAIKYQLTAFAPPASILDSVLGIQIGALTFSLGMIWPWFVQWWKTRAFSCLTILLASFGVIALITLVYIPWNILLTTRESFQTAGNEGFLTLPWIIRVCYFLIPMVAGFFLGLWFVEKPEIFAANSEVKPSAGFIDYVAIMLAAALTALFPIWVFEGFALFLVLAPVQTIPILNGEAGAAVITLREILSQLIGSETTYAILGMVLLSVFGLVLMGIFSIANRIKIGRS